MVRLRSLSLLRLPAFGRRRPEFTITTTFVVFRAAFSYGILRGMLAHVLFTISLLCGLAALLCVVFGRSARTRGYRIKRSRWPFPVR